MHSLHSINNSCSVNPPSEAGSNQYPTTYTHPEDADSAHNRYDPGILRDNNYNHYNYNNTGVMLRTCRPAIQGAESTDTCRAPMPLTRETLLEHNMSTRNHPSPINHGSRHGQLNSRADDGHPGTTVMVRSNFATSPEPYRYGSGRPDRHIYYAQLENISRNINTCTTTAENTHAIKHNSYEACDREDFNRQPDLPECMSTSWPIQQADSQGSPHYSNDLAGVGARFY